MPLLPFLHSLRADVVIAFRQMRKRKAASAAAILSLALTTGACTAAFRLIDALWFRPIPITAPDRLHSVAFEGTGVDGKRNVYDSCSHPMFDRFRTTVHHEAESIAVSYAETVDLTYGSY